MSKPKRMWGYQHQFSKSGEYETFFPKRVHHDLSHLWINEQEYIHRDVVLKAMEEIGDIYNQFGSSADAIDSASKYHLTKPTPDEILDQELADE